MYFAHVWLESALLMKSICKTFSRMSVTLHDESNEHN
jgi:hypothetical protein